MSTDLIARLRKHGGHGFLIGHEAADELERLTPTADDKQAAWEAIEYCSNTTAALLRKYVLREGE